MIQSTERKQELRNFWKRNLEKYIKLDKIEDREYSTRTKPTPGKEDLELVNQTVAEELTQIQEKYVIDLWTLNVIHYVTAILVLELNGNLREERRKRKPHGKPGWQIRLESKIDAIRRKFPTSM